jgi:hypothetical protein
MGAYVQTYSLANHLSTHRGDLVDGLGNDDRRRLTDLLKHIDRDVPHCCPCGARGLKW